MSVETLNAKLQMFKTKKNKTAPKPVEIQKLGKQSKYIQQDKVNKTL